MFNQAMLKYRTHYSLLHRSTPTLFDTLALRSFTTTTDTINYRDPTNPRVFMELTKDGQNIGRLIFEVSLFQAHFAASENINKNLYNLLCSCMPTTPPRPLRTSVPSAVVTIQRIFPTRVLLSAELIGATWPRPAMWPRARGAPHPSTVPSFPMKTWHSNTTRRDNSRWPTTEDPILIHHSFLLRWLSHLGKCCYTNTQEFNLFWAYIKLPGITNINIG